MVLKNKKGDPQDNVLENALSQYTLTHKHTKAEKTWSNGQKLAFAKLLKEYPNGGTLSEFLTCLQASIQVNTTDWWSDLQNNFCCCLFQSICENLVLLDRLLYVKEEAVKLQLKVNVSVKKIVREDISPRCFAIIAEKNKN